jgi:hypothetical protein
MFMFSLTSTMRQLIDQLPLPHVRPRKKRQSVGLANKSRQPQHPKPERSPLLPLFEGAPARHAGLTQPVPGRDIIMAHIGSRPLRCRVDPADRRLTMMSGSFQEVCEALDSMIDEE